MRTDVFSLSNPSRKLTIRNITVSSFLPGEKLQPAVEDRALSRYPQEEQKLNYSVTPSLFKGAVLQQGQYFATAHISALL